jgi:hypothetical protein
MGLMKTLNTVKTMGTARMRLQRGAVMIDGKLSWFFRPDQLLRRIARAEYVFLRNWGRYAQKVARSSIKKVAGARPAPKRKFLADGGTTWTPAYRRWFAEFGVMRNGRLVRPTSEPGKPPFTHTGLLRKAILFAFDPLAESVVVGPSERIIADIGAVHEHGLRHGRGQYPKRPYMVPAETETNKRWQQFWPK